MPQSLDVQGAPFLQEKEGSIAELCSLSHHQGHAHFTREKVRDGGERLAGGHTVGQESVCRPASGSFLLTLGQWWDFPVATFDIFFFFWFFK